MLLHSYDSQTGEYHSSHLAAPNPRRPGEWLQPAFTTPLDLPERTPDTWPFFLDGNWVLKPDYRGRVLYRQDTGEAAEILAAGITPEEAHLTETPRPSEDYHWQDGQWQPDPEKLAENERRAAMAEFESLMTKARRATAGQADALAAGLLNDVQTAVFRAWAQYQMDLVRAISAEGFPKTITWPAEPDAEAIAAQVEAAAAESESGAEATIDSESPHVSAA